MNRHYDGDRVRAVLSRLRELERSDQVMVNIGADLIVGFPGESEADFLKTRGLVSDFGITQLHAFPFSAHLDHYSVPAGKFPHQVPNHIMERRLKDLLQAGEQEKKQFQSSHQGRELAVLIEKIHGSGFSGWSENYIQCTQENFRPHAGQKIARGEVVR